ncbi:MAG: response regulator [Candidatus Aminicenantes bacterium]|nr:response regulator [Candidatus Aminicenantes bacterium]
MKNKLLLIDDEKVFLNSLKTGLDDFNESFDTDICFSVDEATTLLKKNEYGLVITDLRMPLKSGIDLLLHLKDIEFKGAIKVMSAHNTKESIDKIKGLGIVDVISKPFDLKWFKEMIKNYFEEEKDENLTFESIDLLSVMQVINIDKKTVALQVNNNGKRGVIYFSKGEIINAEYEDFAGEEAIMELISLKSSKISVKKLKGKVKRVINYSFVEFMMNIMKKVDELRNESNTNYNDDIKIEFKDEENITNDSLIFDLSEENKTSRKEEEMALKDVLEPLQNEVNGLKTSAVFGKDGLPLAMSNPGNLDIDAFAAKFAMVSALVTKTVRDLSGGALAEVLVEEENGWILARPIGDSDLTLLIAVSKDATLGNLRLVAKKLAENAAQFA